MLQQHMKLFIRCCYLAEICNLMSFAWDKKTSKLGIQVIKNKNTQLSRRFVIIIIAVGILQGIWVEWKFKKTQISQLTCLTGSDVNF